MRYLNVFNNAKWIIGCKIAQSVIQLVVGMLSARYLGPSNYGLINYAASLVAFALPIMQLGFQSTLVQEYVDSPEREGMIMGTALVMNLLSALVCIVGVTAFAAATNEGGYTTVVVCALYSTTLIFQAFEMLQYWFQAKLLSKYSSMAMLVAYVVVSAYKIWLLASGKSVYWFALSHAVEYWVVGCLLLVSYRRHGTRRLGFSLALGRELFAKSKHYIVAMLMVTFFGIGTVFLKLFFNETESGYYSAAFNCMGVTGFVFLAIIDSARPAILENHKRSTAEFEMSVASLYSIIIWLSAAQSVVFAIFAKLLIGVLYGEAFLPAAPVLQILVWNTAFYYMGYVRNVWILAEEQHKMLSVINGCGAAFSILSNLLLIPRWGACGAAVASVLTQLFTNFLLGFVLKPIRPNNRLLLMGLDPRHILRLLRLLKRQPNRS